MDLLGPNLTDIIEDTIAQKFDLKTSLLVFSQLIRTIQYIHERGIIHRDLKPDNFLISNISSEPTIYIIDFGLSKKYIDLKTKEHIPQKKDRSIVGTLRYISPNVHIGIEQSRRDDLISLLYSLIFLYEGKLPWDEIKAKTKEEKLEKIYNYKSQYTPEILCQDFPKEIYPIFEHIFNLNFEETPNYSFIQVILKKIMDNLNIVDDNVYNWMQIEMLIQPIPLISEIKKEKQKKMLLEKKEEQIKKQLEFKKIEDDKKNEAKYDEHKKNPIKKKTSKNNYIEKRNSLKDGSKKSDKK